MVLGDYKLDSDNVNIRWIEFDKELDKQNPISIKLNILIDEAYGNYIFLIRDYNFLYPGFWEGWKNDLDFDVGMNVIINKDNTRYRDMAYFFSTDIGKSWIMKEPFTGPDGQYMDGSPYLPSYEETPDTRKIYCSGTYMVFRTSFIRNYKFNQKLRLCEAEDVELYSRLRKINYKYYMNTKSATGLQKQKDRCLMYLKEEYGTFEYITKNLAVKPAI